MTIKMLISTSLFFSILALLYVPPVSGRVVNFDEWQLAQNKEYTTPEELEYRLAVWNENLRHVEEHNAAYDRGYTSYAKAMESPFADLTDGEFTKLYLMESQDCSATHTSSGHLRTRYSTDSHPAVDWRTKGIMTPIKNQGHCGSCWTFSTSGCLESHICLQSNKDCTQWSGLAEEQLVECAGDFNNHGCNGGLPSQAYEYLKYNGGMALESDYPYKAGNGTCSLSSKTGWRAQVSEVFNITSLDEDDLQHAIATIGPVSVAYQVTSDFRFYSHGIYDSYNSTTNQTMCQSGNHDVNHAVVAVGLGTSIDKHGKSTDYYIIRNSWSADWGMEGHFWIKRGENLCGISDCASFPIVPVTNEQTFSSEIALNSLSLRGRIQ